MPKIEPRALLLIDLVNTWRMKDGRALLKRTLAALPALATLKARAVAAGAPVVYVNDNFGQWKSDFRRVVAQSRAAGENAARIVDALAPGADDYFVLKPRHSAFFASPLELLLHELGIRTLVLAGVAGDQCVLATASAALLRRFAVVVPQDAIACASAARTRAVLVHFRRAMDIPTTPVARLRWR
ncbi:MAG TPA: isochorismatase family cysteine hydrolase [Rudaea sp.]|nr:isochorismatase family cysteine hydrolase [Rudaea sp.]